MKILLTGARGSIGKYLYSYLETKGYEVLGITSGSSERGLIQCDLRDRILVSQLPKADIIVHLAQFPDYKDFPSKAFDIFDVNVGGTQNLLEYGLASKVQKFIYMSTGSIYDLTLGGLLTEESHINPRSYYASTKLAAEFLVMSYAQYFTTTSIRLFNPFSFENDGKLVSNILSKVEEGKEITLTNENGLVMNPLFIKDLIVAIEAVILSGSAGAGIYNFAGPEAVTLKKLSLLYGELVNKPVTFKFIDDVTLNLESSNQKFLNSFNFRFKYRLIDALKECSLKRTTE